MFNYCSPRVKHKVVAGDFAKPEIPVMANCLSQAGVPPSPEAHELDPDHSLFKWLVTDHNANRNAVFSKETAETAGVCTQGGTGVSRSRFCI